MMLRLIPLTRGKYVIVDAEDYGFLMQWKWHWAVGYAVRKERSSEIGADGKRKPVLMHRVLANTPSDLQTDHINGDKLDNRKSNLRVCSITQNQHNQKPKETRGTSKYKGVSWHKYKGNWRATIRKNNIQYELGSFNSEADAALAYNMAAMSLCGEFANINIIERVA